MLCRKGRVRTQDLGYQAERYDHCATRPADSAMQHLRLRIAAVEFTSKSNRQHNSRQRHHNLTCWPPLELNALESFYTSLFTRFYTCAWREPGPVSKLPRTACVKWMPVQRKTKAWLPSTTVQGSCMQGTGWVRTQGLLGTRQGALADELLVVDCALHVVRPYMAREYAIRE